MISFALLLTALITLGAVQESPGQLYEQARFLEENRCDMFQNPSWSPANKTIVLARWPSPDAWNAYQPNGSLDYGKLLAEKTLIFFEPGLKLL